MGPLIIGIGPRVLGSFIVFKKKNIYIYMYICIYIYITVV